MAQNEMKTKRYLIAVELFLSFLGGVLDVYSLSTRGVFGMMQTGNIINSVIYLINGEYEMFFVCAITILGFIVSLVFASILKTYIHKKNIHFYPFALLMNIILLTILLFIPSKFDPSFNVIHPEKTHYINIIANLLLGLIGANMLVTLNRIEEKQITTIMMTANLNRMVTCFVHGIAKRCKKDVYDGLFYLSAVVVFISGALSGYAIINNTYLLYTGSNSYLLSLFPNLVLLLPILIFSVFLAGDIIRRHQDKVALHRMEEKSNLEKR